MRSIKKLLFWIIVADLFLVAFSLTKGLHWLISSQTAFIASLFVTLGSYYSYKRLIYKKIASGDIPDDDRDELDIIEDKHELYEDEVAELKAVIKEERAKLGGIKTTAQNVAKTLSAALSPLRITGYLFLILSFLYINRHGYLEIFGYISGLFVVPLVSFVTQLFSTGEKKG